MPHQKVFVMSRVPLRWARQSVVGLPFALETLVPLAVLPDLIGLAILWGNPSTSPVPRGTRTGCSRKVLLALSVLIELT